MKKLFKKVWAKKKQIFLTLLVLLVIIQFIRPTRNLGAADGPNDIAHFTGVPADVKAVLETSCYDCHSDHTNYPWYTNIQPVGWWMQDHVNEGKGEVNFSQFNTYRIKRKMRKFKEISEQINEDEMPLNSYLWIHGNAKMTAEQKKIVIQWAGNNLAALEQQYPDSVQADRR